MKKLFFVVIATCAMSTVSAMTRQRAIAEKRFPSYSQEQERRRIIAAASENQLYPSCWQLFTACLQSCMARRIKAESGT